MLDVNKEIFRRFGVKNKIKMIASFTTDELLRIKPETVKTLIVRVGSGASNSRNKHLSIPSRRRVGNDWNSHVDSVYVYRKVIYLSFYLQYDNTDTTDVERLEIFLYGSTFEGAYEYDDGNGHIQTAYYRYNREQKAEVIRSILYAFVDAKYPEICT